MTCVPMAQSSGLVYSTGLCDMPSFEGTKTIEVGHRNAVIQLDTPKQFRNSPFIVSVKYLSCPAPLVISRTWLRPTTASALSDTQPIHSLSKTVAFASVSNRHSTSHPRSESSRAIRVTSVCNATSSASSTLSCGCRMSRLSTTLPGTVLVDPGYAWMMPVDARPLCALAMALDATTILAAQSMASDLAKNGVDPVWHSRPDTVTVYQRIACPPVTTPTLREEVSRCGPCSALVKYE